MIANAYFDQVENARTRLISQVMESKIDANVPVDTKLDAKGPATPLKGDAPDAPDAQVSAPPDPDLTFTCDRCNKSVPSSSIEEHQDWHFAQDLQAQEQDGPVAPPPATDARQPSLGKAGGDTLKTPDPSEPPQYAPPSHPPPSRNRTSTSTSTSVVRHHTNQVIEAAKIRARDEVSLPLFQ